ncbi:MAG: DGC domain protein [Acidobacteria bacterium ADurb.Bin340]|nr:MAG: DGC domain protein [Acidobacteria bacterium ADurb.Bin340]HOD31922.1 putative zinc-binding protein [Holophaga sp.]HQL48892.1 putative zinc-binding protein [Holophaga sp.]
MSCGCSSSNGRLLYACSGAANTGALADQVARRLTLLGEGRMTCLAGVGAALDGFMKAAVHAPENLVIDGCPTACGRKTFERYGLPCTAVVLTEHGVVKGETLITPEVVERVTEAVRLAHPGSCNR